MIRQKISEMFFRERGRWAAWVPVLFGTGIGLYFLLPFEPPLWPTLIVIEALLLAAFLLRHRPYALLGLAVFGIMLFGFTTVQLKAAYLNQIPVIEKEQMLYLKGRIVAMDYNTKGRPRLVLNDISDFDDNSLPGKYKITILSKSEGLVPGQCVELVAKVMPPFPTVMIGGYQFDRKSFFDGLKATGYAVSRALPIDCPAETSSPLLDFSLAVKHLRDNISGRIYSVLPPDEASVAAALISGERGNMSRTLVDNYRDSGLAHFLSISGLHMSMLAGLMFFIIRLIMSFIPSLALRYDSKKTAAVFAIFISFVYLLISGAEVPAQRAFIMTFIVLLGILFSRRAFSILTISWAALIVLVIAPEALIGPSFQMSFAAVVALIAFYERFAAPLQRFLNGTGQNGKIVSRLPRIAFAYVAGIMISDLVASLATLPFAVYHFNRIAVYTSLGNLLAGPVIGLVIMPFVLISLLAFPFGLEYGPLKILGWGIGQVNNITAWVSSLPYAGLPVLSMPLWGLVLIVLGGAWLCLWQLKWRLWGMLGIIIGALSVCTVKTPDVLVDVSGKAVAVKDNEGRLVVLPSRGKNFIKSIWLEKTASPLPDKAQANLLRDIWKGKKTAPEWLDISCGKKTCIYRNKIEIVKNTGLKINDRPLDTENLLGASIYLTNDKIKIDSVRGHVGYRYWN